MKARFVGHDIRDGALVTYPGDVGVGAANYHFKLLVRCPICHQLHVVTIDPDGGRNHWNWNGGTMTLTPSVKVTNPERGVCHFTLTGGQFTIHSDSTARRR